MGVSINLSKSVISEELTKITVEYAKRTSFKDVDVSAVSWKMVAAQDNLIGRIAIAKKLVERFKDHNPLSIFSICVGKTRKRTKDSYLAYPIISYYTDLFKKGLVS